MSRILPRLQTKRKTCHSSATISLLVYDKGTCSNVPYPSRFCVGGAASRGACERHPARARRRRCQRNRCGGASWRLRTPSRHKKDINKVRDSGGASWRLRTPSRLFQLLVSMLRYFEGRRLVALANAIPPLDKVIEFSIDCGDGGASWRLRTPSRPPSYGGCFVTSQVKAAPRGACERHPARARRRRCQRNRCGGASWRSRTPSRLDPEAFGIKPDAIKGRRLVALANAIPPPTLDREGFPRTLDRESLPAKVQRARKERSISIDFVDSVPLWCDHQAMSRCRTDNPLRPLPAA